MAYERFYSLDEHFLGWRCVLCGEIIDQVILENRQTKRGRLNREKGENVIPDGTRWGGE